MIAAFLSGVAGEAWKARAACLATAGAWIVLLIKKWHYRSDIHKLHAMSDRQLSDIGLSRSRIEEAVRGEPQAKAKAEPRRQLRAILHR